MNCANIACDASTGLLGFLSHSSWWLVFSLHLLFLGFSWQGVSIMKVYKGTTWYREPPEEKAEEQIFEKKEVAEEEEDKPVSLSPKEVLQTRVFYKIWLGQFAIALAQVDLAELYFDPIHFYRASCWIGGKHLDWPWSPPTTSMQMWRSSPAFAMAPPE